MRKYICILSVSVLSLLLQGCTMYSDKDSVGDPARDVARLMYANTVSPVFYIAEMADFYEAYLEIWEDREASLKLADEYFEGHEVQLYYQDVTVSHWGRISQTATKHFYLVDQLMVSELIPATYSVTSVGDRKYMIECESVGTEYSSWKKFMTDALVSVSDNGIAVEHLEVGYIDRDDVDVHVSCTEPLLSRRMASLFNIPYSGVLDFNISGGISDSFSVSFHPNGIMDINH